MTAEPGRRHVHACRRPPAGACQRSGQGHDPYLGAPPGQPTAPGALVGPIGSARQWHRSIRCPCRATISGPTATDDQPRKACAGNSLGDQGAETGPPPPPGQGILPMACRPEPAAARQSRGPALRIAGRSAQPAAPIARRSSHPARTAPPRGPSTGGCPRLCPRAKTAQRLPVAAPLRPLNAPETPHAARPRH